MYYFFEEDFNELSNKIEEIKERLEKIGKEIGESCNQSSETWHDNFGFEEGRRQQEMWSKQLSDLLIIKSKAVLITQNISANNVVVGSIVEFEDIETKEIQTYRISSYMILKQRHGFISYDSPLAKILMGGYAGEIKTGLINNKEKKVKILKVI